MLAILIIMTFKYHNMTILLKYCPSLLTGRRQREGTSCREGRGSCHQEISARGGREGMASMAIATPRYLFICCMTAEDVILVVCVDGGGSPFYQSQIGFTKCF